MATLRRWTVAALTLCATGAGALADDLVVPAQFARIEDAAAAARAGDRIVVRGRVATATRLDVADVVVDLTRARIDGRLTIGGPRTTVIGGDLRGGLSVHGAHAVVRGARVRGTGVIENPNLKTDWLTRNGGFAVVWVVGDDATLDGLRISAPVGATAIAAAADRLVVRGCDVRGGASGADLSGAAASVSTSRFTGASDFGIGVTSDDARIEGDVVGAMRQGTAVSVRGDRAVVVRNRVLAARGVGISVDGDGGVIERNEVRSTGVARSIAFRGGSGAVRGNTVARPVRLKRARSDSIATDPDAFALDVGAAVFVDGIANEVSGNHVAGGATGMTVCGCGNTITANTVNDVSLDGVVVAGEGSSVTDSVVDGAARTGIVLLDPIVVSGGTVSDCGGAGIVAFGGGCSLSGCTLTDNAPVDVVTYGDVATSGLAPGVRVLAHPAIVPAPQPIPDEPVVGTDPIVFVDPFLGGHGD
jgi:hypothetical protein